MVLFKCFRYFINWSFFQFVITMICVYFIVMRYSFIRFLPFCRANIFLSSIVLRIFRIRGSTQNGNIVMRNWVWIHHLSIIVIIVSMEKRFFFFPNLVFVFEIPCSRRDSSSVYNAIFCHSEMYLGVVNSFE